MNRLVFPAFVFFAVALMAICINLQSAPQDPLPLHPPPALPIRPPAKPVENKFFSFVHVTVSVSGGTRIIPILSEESTLEKIKKISEGHDVKCIFTGHRIDPNGEVEPLRNDEQFFLCWIVRYDGNDEQKFEKFSSIEDLRSRVKNESTGNNFRLNGAFRGVEVK